MAVVIVLIILSPGYTKAQEKDYSNAYWVIERNISRPDVSFVKFYSMEGILFHEVMIEGKVINIQRSRHKRKLDHLLKRYTNRSAASGKKFRSVSSI
jgi:hypothetical protein